MDGGVVRLDEDRIERYSRQILLPGVGGRGQQALLASRVRVLGEGRGAELLATWLAGAGVGRLDPHGFEPAPALRSRNPDVTWGPVDGADLTVALGPGRHFDGDGPLVWATATRPGVVCLRAPERPPCEHCLATILERTVDTPPTRAPLLASVAATAALGVLLGLAPGTEGEVLDLSLRPPGASRFDLGAHIH